MSEKNPFLPDFESLPNTLPIFPLSGAVVLPGGSLPLNIFEPRYLRMVRDALKSDLLIGMIQPKSSLDAKDLYDVGCAGRISQYSERNDGRLEIVLTGVCRFKVHQELESMRGYRLIMPDWSNFEHDFDNENPDDSIINFSLKKILNAYFVHNGIEADWGVLDQLSNADLVNNLIACLPIKPEDKQLLIETPSKKDLINRFMALLNVPEKNSETLH